MRARQPPPIGAVVALNIPGLKSAARLRHVGDPTEPARRRRTRTGDPPSPRPGRPHHFRRGPLPAGDGPHDREGLGPVRDRVGERVIRRLVGQDLLAVEEPAAIWPVLRRDDAAARPALPRPSSTNRHRGEIRQGKTATTRPCRRSVGIATGTTGRGDSGRRAPRSARSPRTSATSSGRRSRHPCHPG